MDSKLIQLTGLWANQSKDGGSYLSGKLGARANLLIFKNKNKRPNSNDPDYFACLAPVEPKEQDKQKKDDDIGF